MRKENIDYERIPKCSRCCADSRWAIRSFLNDDIGVYGVCDYHKNVILEENNNIRNKVKETKNNSLHYIPLDVNEAIKLAKKLKLLSLARNKNRTIISKL